MHYRNLIHREPWMTKEEWRTVLRHRRSLLQTCDERGVSLTPYLMGRVKHLLVAILMCQRVENAALMPRLDEGGNDDPEGREPRMVYPVPTDAELNTMFYLRDQLHRIHLEVEALVNNNGLPLTAWIEKLTCPLMPSAEATEGTHGTEETEATEAVEETCTTGPRPETEPPAPAPAPESSNNTPAPNNGSQRPPIYQGGRRITLNANKRPQAATSPSP